MARRIPQRSADDLRVRDVTIYGVLLDKRPCEGGYLMYYPEDHVVRIDHNQTLPVFCKATETMLEAIKIAILEEQVSHGRR